MSSAPQAGEKISRSRVVWLAISLIAAGWLLIVGVQYLVIDNSPGDVFFATLSKLDGDFTIYAPGYREANFRSLRLGMTPAEVEAALGPPLEVRRWLDAPAGLITTGAGPLEPSWSYTRAGKPRRGSYWRREVFFRAGAVVRIADEFYLD